jgi:hypothetical protein
MTRVIFSSVLSVALIYTIGAIISWSINPAEWWWGVRLLVVVWASFALARIWKSRA